MFVREQLTSVLIGVFVGAGMAASATRFIKSYLFKTQPADPLLWTVSIAILVAVAGVAAFIPARQASRLNPVDALRTE
jgi:ABC-type antimicrobial peptide transport system permease subunit